MIPEIGLFCLVLAMTLSLSQAAIFSFVGSMRFENIMRPLAFGQVFFVCISFLVLGICFITDDFSVSYVAHNSSSLLPVFYKITAIWGAHEGSLLLWILILSLWMLFVAIQARNWQIEFGNKVLYVLGAVNIGLLTLLLLFANPFMRLLPGSPLDGADLNPLLQDFGMIIHPPILYLGYVGCTVPFAFAIAALLEGRVDVEWAIRLRPWVLASWSFLTLGIMLGSWWAYYELGWGGWWFWDPVENASFMPWLTMTALLHSISLSKRNAQFLPLTVFLAIASFALSLLGTFLVRSGIISSVHAFANDPERGVLLLLFLGIVIGGSLLLYGIKAPKLNLLHYKKTGYDNYTLGLLANNLLLLVAAGTVLLGTAYPLIHDIVYAEKITVGYPYFNIVFTPIMLVMFASMLPVFISKIKNMIYIILISVSLSILTLYIFFGFIEALSVVGLSFAYLIICSTLKYFFNKNNLPMVLAHIGLAISIIGISITPIYQIEKDLRMSFGDQIQIANYKIEFQEIVRREGENYLAHIGRFVVTKNQSIPKLAEPEKRLFLVQETVMTETAILPSLFSDLYIALGEQIQPGLWSMRIYYKPFIRWIWMGAILMATGAIFGIFMRKINDKS